MSIVFNIKFLKSQLYCIGFWFKSQRYYLDFALEPVYRPNHAAPAPTTILTKPDCSIVGAARSMYHITTLYSRNM